MLSATLQTGLSGYAIGEKIRALRLKKKMGLVELGQHTGRKPFHRHRRHAGQPQQAGHARGVIDAISLAQIAIRAYEEAAGRDVLRHVADGLLHARVMHPEHERNAGIAALLSTDFHPERSSIQRRISLTILHVLT